MSGNRAVRARKRPAAADFDIENVRATRTTSVVSICHPDAGVARHTYFDRFCKA
jgi:hypothetical protein